MAKQKKKLAELNKRLKQKIQHRRLIGGIIIAAIVIAAGIISLMIYQNVYAAKVLPRSRIADNKIGGFNAEQVADLTETYANSLAEAGIKFSYSGWEVILYPTVSAADDPDLTYTLFSIDANTTARNALLIGHRSSVWQNVIDHINAMVVSHEVPVAYKIDYEAVADYLKENYSDVDQPAVNASLTYQDGVFSVVGENSGQILDYQSGLQALQARLRALSFDPITINIIDDEPAVTYADAQNMIGDAQAVIARAPFVLRADEDISWEVNQDTFGHWLTVANNKGNISFSLKTEPITEFLNDKKTKYDIAMNEAKFEMKEGRVTEFQAGRTGREIDVAGSINLLADQLLVQKKTEGQLMINSVDPTLTTSKVNDLGIVELLGTGHSNFSGSPANRRHNISVGASSLHGLLVEPDKEFSLGEALGEIEANTGYLPELVIKGNKTIPEYGGGLCQIGTTTFRAAMAAGLPVTERQNHSYNVSYYLENGKPGTDATIYPPHPDLRFVNDTGRHILIQTRIEGNDIYFDFWGTSDGREASRTAPRVWGWTAPPDTNEVETTDLAPGERKCTERAHSGVSTEFTYTVKMPDGETREQVFASRYKPWQEVCLIGVAATQ
ncbi:MAG: VanW family protein [Patescibacteria group bacterium]